MALHEELKTQGDFLFRNRSYLPLLILGVGISVFIHTKYNTTDIINTTVLFDIYSFICLSISLIGFLIRVLTVGYTPRNTSGRNTKVGQVAEELNTTGLYSIVRHPLYVGNFFMWLGVAILTQNMWFIIAFILFYWLYYERIMYAEEAFLRQKFGRAYQEWARVTPAFVPSLKNYTREKYAFNIQKVLKKEKNGLVAIFLLFWFFNFIEICLSEHTLKIEYNFWFYAAIITSIIYLILKILKKNNYLNN